MLKTLKILWMQDMANVFMSRTPYDKNMSNNVTLCLFHHVTKINNG